jgi:hypothetical protein
MPFHTLLLGKRLFYNTFLARWNDGKIPFGELVALTYMQRESSMNSAILRTKSRNMRTCRKRTVLSGIRPAVAR